MSLQVICKHNSTEFAASKWFDEFVRSNAIEVGVLVGSSNGRRGVAGRLSLYMSLFLVFVLIYNGGFFEGKCHLYVY